MCTTDPRCGIRRREMKKRTRILFNLTQVSFSGIVRLFQGGDGKMGVQASSRGYDISRFR